MCRMSVDFNIFVSVTIEAKNLISMILKASANNKIRIQSIEFNKKAFDNSVSLCVVRITKLPDSKTKKWENILSI